MQDLVKLRALTAGLVGRPILEDEMAEFELFADGSSFLSLDTLADFFSRILALRAASEAIAELEKMYGQLTEDERKAVRVEAINNRTFSARKLVGLAKLKLLRGKKAVQAAASAAGSVKPG